jgi:uncharacterized FlaG/YvyC family protein
MVPMIKGQLARLKKPSDGKPSPRHERGDEDQAYMDSEADETKLTTDQRLEKLERLVQEMNDRLKSMETRLPPPKQ